MCAPFSKQHAAAMQMFWKWLVFIAAVPIAIVSWVQQLIAYEVRFVKNLFPLDDLVYISSYVDQEAFSSSSLGFFSFAEHKLT